MKKKGPLGRYKLDVAGPNKKFSLDEVKDPSWNVNAVPEILCRGSLDSRNDIEEDQWTLGRYLRETWRFGHI